jgi:hypothetical protein
LAAFVGGFNGRVVPVMERKRDVALESLGGQGGNRDLIWAFTRSGCSSTTLWQTSGGRADQDAPMPGTTRLSFTPVNRQLAHGSRA